MWHWLVNQGLYRDLVSWGVGFLLGGLLGSAVAWRIRVGRRLKQLIEYLDTTTRGGLGDLVKALEDNAKAITGQNSAKSDK